MPRLSSFRRIQPALYDAKSAPGERERWPWNPISAAGEVLGRYSRYRRCRGTGGKGCTGGARGEELVKPNICSRPPLNH